VCGKYTSACIPALRPVGGPKSSSAHTCTLEPKSAQRFAHKGPENNYTWQQRAEASKSKSRESHHPLRAKCIHVHTRAQQALALCSRRAADTRSHSEECPAHDSTAQTLAPRGHAAAPTHGAGALALLEVTQLHYTDTCTTRHSPPRVYVLQVHRRSKETPRARR